MPINLDNLRKKLGVSTDSQNQEKTEPITQQTEPDHNSSKLDIRSLINSIKNAKSDNLDTNTAEKNKALINKAANNIKQAETQKIMDIAKNDPDLQRLADILNNDEPIQDVAEYARLLEKATNFAWQNKLKKQNDKIKLFTLKKDQAKQQLDKYKTIEQSRELYKNELKEKENVIKNYIESLTNLYNLYAEWDIMQNNDLMGMVNLINSFKQKAGVDTTDTLKNTLSMELINWDENLPDLQELPTLRKKYSYLS